MGRFSGVLLSDLGEALKFLGGILLIIGGSIVCAALSSFLALTLLGDNSEARIQFVAIMSLAALELPTFVRELVVLINYTVFVMVTAAILILTIRDYLASIRFRMSRI